MKSMSRVVVLWLFMMGVSWGQNSDLPIRGTNTKYEQGDWITYGQTRFVTSIALGQQFVYFGTTGGITRYDYWKNEWEFPFTISSGLADNSIKTIAFDENTSLLWAVTETAISVYTPSSEQWANYFLEDRGVTAHGDIVAIGFTQSSATFEFNDGYLFSCSNTGGWLRPYDSNYDGQNIQWAGYHQAPKGEYPHYFMDPGYFFLLNGTIQDDRLHKAPITVRLHDKWFKSWIGSWGMGALLGNTREQQLSFLNYGLFSRDVRAIALDKNGLWVGGENRNTSSIQDVNLAGLTYWNQVTEKWLYYESDFIPNLITDEVNRMTVAGSNLFCATRFGLSIFNKRQNEWTKLTTFDGLNHENIFDVAVHNGVAYVASEGGLNAFEIRALRTDTLEVYLIGGDDLKLSRVLDIEINENLLWAATDYGIYVYNIEEDTGGFVDDVNGPVGERITAVTAFKSEVWFGTSRGIFPYDIEKKEWLGLPEKNFSIDALIYEMAADKHSIWAATDQGVYKLNRRLRNWVHYTKQDGLSGNTVRAVLLDGDYVWFGTPEGLTLFYWNDPNRVD
ncbi:MAG: hypothetical protein DWQ05_03325 [Calditrichaeota bacterium]|nr:MAG: hypothetical protein DWQ05_03325 [Calditrichota bacterium]